MNKQTNKDSVSGTSFSYVTVSVCSNTVNRGNICPVELLHLLLVVSKQTDWAHLKQSVLICKSIYFYLPLGKFKT